MHQARFAAWTRRRFLTRAAGLAAATTVLPVGSMLQHGTGAVSAPGAMTLHVTPRLPLAPSPSLIDQVTTACERLAPEGWRDLLLAVSNDELDITSADLPVMLSQPLTKIDRTIPG